MVGVTLDGIPTLDAAIAHVCARQQPGAELRSLQRLLALREESPFALQTLGDVCAADEQQANRLRVASSHYAGTRLVTIRDALREHGYRNVYCVSLVGCFVGAVDAAMLAPAHAGWWRHAVRLAVIAQAVARGTNAHLDTAFAAGLVADLGDLLLPAYFPDLHAEAQRFGPGAANERAAWGYTRHDVAAGFVAGWGFPDETVDAIAGRPCARCADRHPPQLVDVLERAHRVERRYLDHCGSPEGPTQIFPDEPVLAAYLEGHGGLHWLHVLTENMLETAFVDRPRPSTLVA